MAQVLSYTQCSIEHTRDHGSSVTRDTSGDDISLFYSIFWIPLRQYRHRMDRVMDTFYECLVYPSWIFWRDFSLCIRIVDLLPCTLYCRGLAILQCLVSLGCPEQHKKSSYLGFSCIFCQ